MKNDKLKSRDIRFFIIPFLVLTLLFGIFTSFDAVNRYKERYKIIQDSTLRLADSYTTNFANSKAASDIINNLMDDKLLVASRAILLSKDNKSNETLAELAQKFQVDEIYLYNRQGKIIYSNVSKYIGWKAYESHPVHDFMKSGKQTFVEDIRADTESGIYYKYAYVRAKDDTFVQIGVLADKVYKFLQKFQPKRLVEDIMKIENVINVFFTDTNFNVLACGNKDYLTSFVNDEHFREHISVSKARAGRASFNGIEALHVCAPVYYNGEKSGTLTILWSPDIIYKEINSIVVKSTGAFLVITITVGGILYYAYRKYKSNIKMAYYDKLTDLPNSEYLTQYLEQEIKSADKTKKAAILLNCTNFKIINMTYGFIYADSILKQIANNIKNAITDSDIMIFRLNGDRFVLTVKNYSGPEELTAVCEKLIDIYKRSFASMNKYEYINVNASIFEIRNNDITSDKVLQDASLALEAINNDTNQHIVFYNDEMEDIILRRDKIEKSILAIITCADNSSFHLKYQPKLDIKTNKIIGFEALARMNIEGMGSISPEEFIEIAEKQMLIFDIGNLILDKTCEFLAKLKTCGYRDIGVAVNISALQLLRPEFIETVINTVTAAGVDFNLLEFEITESVLIDNYELINNKLIDIKNLGISVSLDDFGTGFSSFARLSELNVDSVKIDGYFINRIDKLNEEDIMIADIISMAHKIGLTAVAEGVCNKKQFDYLKKNDCDIMQGYLLSKPLSDDEAIDFLKQNRS